MKNNDLTVEKIGTKIRIKIRSKDAKRIEPAFVDIPFHLADHLILRIGEEYRKIMNQHKEQAKE